MAISETIKHALQAAEEAATWALNASETLVAAAGEQGTDEAPWIAFHHRAITQLGERIDALATAIHRSAQ